MTLTPLIPICSHTSVTFAFTALPHHTKFSLVHLNTNHIIYKYTHTCILWLLLCIYIYLKFSTTSITLNWKVTIQIWVDEYTGNLFNFSNYESIRVVKVRVIEVFLYNLFSLYNQCLQVNVNKNIWLRS